MLHMCMSMNTQTYINMQKMESLLPYKLIFPQHLVMKLLKHIEELEQLYNEYPHTYHLDSVNISLYMAY